MKKTRLLTCVTLTVLIAHPLWGQAAKPSPEAVVAEVVKAAEALLQELEPAQRKQLLFAFDDQEQRNRWSNLPTGIFPRQGLRMGDLNAKQKAAVLQLLRATLSEVGYQQVIDNITGDEILNQRGSPGRIRFGKDEFYVSILGEPSVSKPWMWQFGGHHLAINATIVDDQITLSPSLTGGQPVDYVLNGKRVRQLGKEEDLAFALAGSLSMEQRQQAVLDDHHVNLAYGPSAKAIQPKAEGIRIDKLNPKQQALVKQLIQERIGILNNTHSQIALEKIEKDLPRTYFAWFGPTEKGKPAGFRIQGPSVIIEYSPQHLGGDPTDHTHAIYRDPSNDYGKQWIADR